MKTSKLYTWWVIFLAILYTAITSGSAIIKQLFGTINRDWVDKRMYLWVDQILNLVGIKVKIVNPHDVAPKKDEPTIIMCNHSSLFDIPISLKAFAGESIRMLAKKELSKIPIMSGGMKAAEFPFVDRKNRAQAIKDLKYVQKLMESGIVMWIAPEGTRSKDGKVAKFKKGGFITAIHSKATIIPIGIRGAYDILPPRTRKLNLNQTAEVHIGEPIDASQYTLNNKDELIDKTYQAIKTLAGDE